MKLKAVFTVALFALGMATAVAIAKPPPAPGDVAATAAQERASELKCRGGHMNLAGTVASVDLGTSQFTMNVTKSNKKGRELVDKTATVVVGDKTKIRRHGKSSLDKLVVGDRVGVLVRKCRDDDGEAALMAKLVVVKGAKQEEEEEQETTSTSTSTSTSTETTTTTTTTSP